MKTISLKLPDKLDVLLEVAARQRRVSKSALLREALEQHLQPDNNASYRFLAKAADLAGSVKAPADLSFARAHLAPYGK